MSVCVCVCARAHMRACVRVSSWPNMASVLLVWTCVCVVVQARLSNLMASASTAHSLKPRTPLSSSKARIQEVENVRTSLEQKLALRDVFIYYASWGEKHNYMFMSRSQFIRFGRDAHLLGGQLDSVGLSLIFEKVRVQRVAAAGGAGWVPLAGGCRGVRSASGPWVLGGPCWGGELPQSHGCWGGRTASGPWVLGGEYCLRAIGAGGGVLPQCHGCWGGRTASVPWVLGGAYCLRAMGAGGCILRHRGSAPISLLAC